MFFNTYENMYKHIYAEIKGCKILRNNLKYTIMLLKYFKGGSV